MSQLLFIVSPVMSVNNKVWLVCDVPGNGNSVDSLALCAHHIRFCKLRDLNDTVIMIFATIVERCSLNYETLTWLFSERYFVLRNMGMETG